MLQWMDDNQALLWWLTAAGVAMFIASLLIMPAIIIRIPADYFTHAHRPRGQFSQSHPVVRIAYRSLKTLLGVVLVIAGVAMLVLPGQGLLTILVGLFLVEFPGKYQLEKAVITRPRVLGAINWLRRRHKRPPLLSARLRTESAAEGAPGRVAGLVRPRGAA